MLPGVSEVQNPHRPVGFRNSAKPGLAYTGAMSTPYRLHYAPDNASLVIRLALEEMGLPYQTVLVDRRAEGQRAPAYLALNPNGLIPVLETPKGAIFETAAILLWLVDRHEVMGPQVTAADRAAFLKWLFFVSNTLHADARILFYAHLYAGPDAAAQDQVRAQVESRIARHLELLEDVAGAGCSFLGAEEVGVLDGYVACLMRWVQLYPADRDKGWFSPGAMPHLFDMLTRLERRPSALAAIDAEWLGPTPFSNPRHPQPPEGSAT